MCHVLHSYPAGARLDWVTATLEVLLSQSAAAAVQSAATPLLQPYGFVPQPGPLGSASSTCCASPSQRTAGSAAVESAGTSSSQQADGAAATSSYDELIAASSSPAAMLGRLLENAPNLARVTSSRASIGAASPLSSTTTSLAQPSSRLRPAAAQLFPPLPGSSSLSQEAQQQAAAMGAMPEQPAAAGGVAGPKGATAAAEVVLEGMPGAAAAAPDSYKFNIEGMSCASCVASVQGAVQQVGEGCGCPRIYCWEVLLLSLLVAMRFSAGSGDSYW